MKKKIFFVILILIVAGFIIRSINAAKKSSMIDLNVNIKAAGNLLNSKELYFFQPYNGGYTYLPAVSIFYIPLKYLSDNFSQNTAKFCWTIFNIIIALMSLLIIYKTGCFENKSAISILLFIALFLFFQPLHHNIKYGNIKIILLFGYLLLFNFKNNSSAAGIILGILVVLSIQPLILIPYFIIKKKYKIILVSAITISSVIILSLLIVPVSEYILYFSKVIPQLQFEGSSSAPYIQSIDAMCKRLFLEYNEYTIEIYNSYFLALKLPIILKVGFLSITLYFIYKSRHIDDKNYFQFSIMFLCMILIHSINWEYHYTIILAVITFFYKKVDFISAVLSFKIKCQSVFILFFILCLLIGLYYPYDHKFFLSGIPIFFTNTKLFSLIGIYFILLKKIDFE
ncbi:DUF2029 domain-containing protein [Candidatus Dependentiae bacterium]|nr:DUF2029 domain-containing protein [Candidatus Dependentiae bacterium]